MNILVSNDDGINSKALKTLVKVLSDIGDVYVVAPDSERSANSHHFTMSGRMRIEEKQLEGAKKAYALWGTPCDCIHAGLKFIIKEKIDLVVSGINKGWNTSHDAIYSGTIAAAREGFMQGVQAIAFSLNTFEDRDYSDAALVAKEIILKYIENKNPNYFLNVNIPDLPKDKIKGTRVCNSIGRVNYDENYYYQEEFGVTYLTLGDTDVELMFDQNNYDIDCVSLNDGYITVVPLYNDQINHEYINEVKQIYEEK